ncbi:DUF1302 family protein [Porphyromonas levii]|uniref:DUF1302 family protein n=1 Tax=Porphyromonas levii TaxID=28114 RepID=UPI001B8B0B91|nr:DUF1302 family protein [Porphyromonas levii]MBR8712211.1 hypothetical protein [Porphyromonas levii]MBR8714323.1 hypothetical protein [Porphyromonas levii]MBR8726864.1 hypothetical protein [Porphyromonas levii]MBR8735171.1 hypothetical protein [Porphyromonas levii]MBR8765174.1 hypothetical protein [Porphyromonas levii]
MTNVTNHPVKFLLLFLLLLPLNTVWGQEEGDSSWQLKGFVDTYHAIRSERPNDFMSSRTRVRGEVGKSFGGSTLFVSFNATHNALLKAHTGFELREAYLDHREEHWGFRLGRQLVIWGVADGVRVTDLVSPMDMTEFLARDYDDIRMPVNALRFFVFNEKMKLELLAVPTFEGYKLPTDAENPWSLFPKNSAHPFLWSEEGSRPEFRFSNIEYGGKLGFTLPGVDFSFAALHTWNKMPVVTYRPSGSHITVSPQYYRMGFFGADISKPLGQFVVRGEAAFNVDKHFSYKPEASAMEQKGFNTVNYLVGVDWYAPNEWTLMAQFSSESILKYETQIAQPRHQSLLTLNVSKKLLDSTLQLSNFTYFDINHKGWFSRFTSSYALNDYIQLSLGYDWFGGSEGIFGTYKNNSEIWAKAKYSF